MESTLVRCPNACKRDAGKVVDKSTTKLAGDTQALEQDLHNL